jgi:hypothetical protein
LDLDQKAARLAISCPNRTTMHLDRTPRNCQAKPESGRARLLVSILPEANERLEHRFERLVRHTWPAIGDPDFETPGRRVCLELDRDLFSDERDVG